MIRVTHQRPRTLRVPGVKPMVIEVNAGGLIRIREAGKRTWYNTHMDSIWWAAARKAAEEAKKRKAAEKRARKAARRAARGVRRG